MSFWKAGIGGMIGFTIGGPIGGILGAIIGSKLGDKEQARPSINQKNQAAFLLHYSPVLQKLLKQMGK